MDLDVDLAKLDDQGISLFSLLLVIGGGYFFFLMSIFTPGIHSIQLTSAQQEIIHLRCQHGILGQFEKNSEVCFVLFCFVLFCFVLFCFVLFCFVLCFVLLFCFIACLFLNFCFLLGKDCCESEENLPW